MKIVFCVLVLVSPVTAWGLTISAFSHLEEHIPALNQTDNHTASSGSVSSYVESDPLPEHYLQGNTSASAEEGGSLNVSATGLGDMQDGEETYFKSIATFSEDYLNDDMLKHYFFYLDVSDVHIGSDYRCSPNRTGYSIDIFLNDRSIFHNSYVFDTSQLYSEYFNAMMSGDPHAPPGQTYFTIAATSYVLDLGRFSLDELFTLRYQISAFAQPIDDSRCYTELGLNGRLVAKAQPVPEPASCLLVLSGIGCLVMLRATLNKKRTS